MPNAPIRREDAKAAVLEAMKPLVMPSYVREMILSSLDIPTALPAAGDERYADLFAELQRYRLARANAFGRRTYNPDSADPVSQEMAAWACVLALLSAPAPEVETRAGGRPPMLYACTRSDAGDKWNWFMHTIDLDDNLWILGWQCGLKSYEISAVDRTASDALALELYDKDLASR